MTPGTLATGFHPIDRGAHEVLIVDDDPAARYATTRRLASAGFRTVEAASGAEALAAIRPSLSAVLLDVHLPDIDGFALCRHLRSLPEISRIPILQMSAAYVTDDDKVRGLDSGADAYLTHPVDAAVLVATVQALVRTRQAEAAMRRSEANFKAIYLNAPTGLCLLDAEGRFLDANPALQRLLMRPLEGLVGRAVVDFVVPADAERARAMGTGLRAGDGESLAELSLRNGHGRTIPMEWRLSFHSEGVTMAQVIDVSAHRSEQRTQQLSIDRERDARANAEQLNRMKDEFIAVLSHELRSPLNAMMGWTHVLLRQGGAELQLRALRAIERNGQAQARLIADLLDMSRLNVGKMRLTRTLVDVAEVVESAVASLQPTLEENGNAVVLDLEPGLPLVYGDGARLQQVITNLLSNAVKFSPRDASIEVQAASADGGVCIRVRDHGRGIAPEFIPHLFERFTQADSANQRYRSGLGLGLTIVSHLVQAHGGRVSGASEGPGHGATFEVWLPIGTPEAAATGAEDDAPDAPLEMPLQGRRLLLVDDDTEALLMLQVVLSDRGATVEFAHDHDEALAALQRQRPDLLVCDIGLPGKDGHQVIREIRRREGDGPRLPAVALTAFAQRSDHEQALAAGFDAYLNKPVRPLLLVKTIGELLGRGGPATGEAAPRL
jgi:PAS domain S-box-containing protein